MSPRALPRWVLPGSLVCLLGILASLWLLTDTSFARDNTRYIDATGHYISNEYGFLDYWQAQQGAAALGNPVTELLIENDVVVQYFEYARLEAHIGVDGQPLLRGHIGAEYAEALWLNFAPVSAQTPTPGVYRFEATGHTLREPFLTFWREHDGFNTLGYPISELRWEYVDNDMLHVQYFERGRLEHHPAAPDPANQVQVSKLGLALAALRGYDTAPIGPAALPAATATPSASDTAPLTSTDSLSETAPAPVPAPPPVPQGATPPQQTFFRNSPAAVEADWEVATEVLSTTNKLIIVDITTQRLYAYEADTLMFDVPISTGMDGFETPEGDFFIYARNPLQTMSGDLGGPYSVPNVPNSMYIIDDVAIHGTYWHNEFGTGVRRSHGCINLPLDGAARLYAWSSVGIPVRVTRS